MNASHPSPTSPTTLLSVERVTKRYGSTLAVDDVSFALRAGEIVGFLGPNGAGKSTLLKMISTFFPPDSGRIEVAGCDVSTRSLDARARLGYLAEHNALYDTMRVERYLAFVGQARGLSGARLRDRIAWVVDACALSAVLRKRVQECSKGYRQRIGLGAALIHDPPVIALDEPTHGLDPLQMAAFRDFLARLAPGRAILFSSHLVFEVVETSSRVIAIQKGRLVADSPTRDLAARAAELGRSLEAHLVDVLGREAGARVEGSTA